MSAEAEVQTQRDTESLILWLFDNSLSTVGAPKSACAGCIHTVAVMVKAANNRRHVGDADT